jgi:hypothetical protein
LRRKRKEEKNAFVHLVHFTAITPPSIFTGFVRVRTVIVWRLIAVNFTSTLLAMLRSLLVI